MGISHQKLEDVTDSTERKVIAAFNFSLQKIAAMPGDPHDNRKIIADALESHQNKHLIFKGVLPTKAGSVAQLKQSLAQQLPHLHSHEQVQDGQETTDKSASGEEKLDLPAPAPVPSQPSPVGDSRTAPQIGVVPPSQVKRVFRHRRKSSGSEASSASNPDITPPLPRQRSNSLAAKPSDSAVPSLLTGSVRAAGITHVPTMKGSRDRHSQDSMKELADREEAYRDIIAGLDVRTVSALQGYWMRGYRKNSKIQVQKGDKIKTKRQRKVLEEDLAAIIGDSEPHLAVALRELQNVCLMRLTLQKLASDYLALPLRALPDESSDRIREINLYTLANNLLRQSFHISHVEEQILAYPKERESDEKLKFLKETGDLTRIFSGIMDRFPIPDRAAFTSPVLAIWTDMRQQIINTPDYKYIDDSGPLLVEAFLKKLKNHDIEDLENNQMNNASCERVIYLLRAFSQDLYMLPLKEIKSFFSQKKFTLLGEAKKDDKIERDENDEGDYLFKYAIAENGTVTVECVSTLNYSFNQLFKFQVQIRQQLVSESLPKWNSTLRIFIDHRTPENHRAVKDPSVIPDALSEHVLDPLFDLGYAVDVPNGIVEKKA